MQFHRWLCQPSMVRFSLWETGWLNESCRIITGCLKSTPIDKTSYLTSTASGNKWRWIAANSDRLKHRYQMHIQSSTAIPPFQIKLKGNYYRTYVNPEETEQSTRTIRWTGRTTTSWNTWNPRRNLSSSHMVNCVTWNWVEPMWARENGCLQMPRRTGNFTPMPLYSSPLKMYLPTLDISCFKWTDIRPTVQTLTEIWLFCVRKFATFSLFLAGKHRVPHYDSWRWVCTLAWFVHMLCPWELQRGHFICWLGMDCKWQIFLHWAK